jgi:hypothetical protein
VPYVGDSARVIPFEQLRISDLQLEAVYLGGNPKNVKDDPLDPVVPGVGNQGGFRYAGSPWKKTVRVSVLYTSGVEVDWPDSLDPQTGEFTYYGDNRSPDHGQRRFEHLLIPFFDATAPRRRADRYSPRRCRQRAHVAGRDAHSCGENRDCG